MFRKVIFLFVLLCLYTMAASSAASEPIKITYSTVAVPIKRAVQDIAKLSHQQLETSPSIESEIVVIDVKDVSLDDLLSRLAKVVSGKWDTVSGVRILSRSLDAVRQEEKNDPKQWCDNIREEIKTAITRFEQPDSSPPNSEKYVERTTPSEYLAARLLQQVDLERYWRGGSKPIVYSTRPNRLQQPFPISTQTLFGAYLKQIRGERDAAVAERQENLKRGELVEAEEEDEYKRIDSPLDKAIMILGRHRYRDELLIVSFILFNKQGKIIFEDHACFDGYRWEESPIHHDDFRKSPVTFRPISQEFLNLYRSVNVYTAVRPPFKQPSRELHQMLLRPDLYDPLSYVCSDALLSYTRAKQKQLVACLPDSILNLHSQFRERNTMTIGEFMGWFTNESSVRLNEDDNWFTVQPRLPTVERKKRMNRASFAKFIQSAQKGYIDYQAKVQISMANPTFSEIEFENLDCYFVCGSEIVFSTTIDSAFYRFLGQMSPMNTNILMEGGAVSFSALSPPQLEWLRCMTYDEGCLEFDDKSYKLDDYRFIPSELFPTGLPRDGSIRMKQVSQAVVRDAPELTPTLAFTPGMTAVKLGIMMYFKTDPEQRKQWEPYVGDYKRFFLGEKTDYTFTFTLSPGVSMSTTIQEVSFPSEGVRIKYADLPASFRDEADEYMKNMKKLINSDLEFDPLPGRK